VVGGGIAGLVASIASAEQGCTVELFEAGPSLGGRARTRDGDFRANLGAHVLYADGKSWPWLEERDLLPPWNGSPKRGLRFVHEGSLKRVPPKEFLQGLRLRERRAPSDLSFAEWAAREVGEDAVSVLANSAAVFTFDHDPGRLAAEFIRQRCARVLWSVPQNRYLIGGWQSLVDSLEKRARELGVEIHTDSPVEELPEPPVIVATEVRRARKLLGEELPVDTTRCVLLDLGLTEKRGDPFIVFDLDGGGWLERYSAADETLAPEGHDLIQGHLGIRPGESPDETTKRLEELADIGFEGWRERTVWRRRQVVDGMTGALDLPGRSWRDRPSIDRGGGVFLAGDYTAARGLLSEVAFASGIEAAAGAVAAARGAGNGAAAPVSVEAAARGRG
jgi:phytoene dehydrogenase-like protein